MIRGAKFWIPMAICQVAFGLAVFAATRHYYISETDTFGADLAGIGDPRLPVWPDGLTEAAVAQFRSSTSNSLTGQDPVEISRLADESFTNKQYDRAAQLYEQLLAFGPNNVDTYNNLGITLHYLGRSTEALRKLNEGVALDPTHQRIWLTLGFVDSQLGNVEQARTELTTAAQIDAGSDIGRSALRMLEDLP